MSVPFYVSPEQVIKDKADPWHRRYGHLGYGALSRLKRHNMVIGLEVSEADFKAAGDAVCEPCVMGKHHRQPFPTSAPRSTKRLELLHMDVCSPRE